MIAYPPDGPPPAARREVAVTFDDLPVISVTRWDVASHRAITTRLLEAVAAHEVPAVGFVNEENLLADGVADPGRVALLRQWLDAGLELGNHTFAHLDLNATLVGRFEDDVVRGEPVTRGLLDARGLSLRYFRHPYLRTGTDLAVKRRLETFLAGRGYRIAPVTVTTEDYLFAAAYDRAVELGRHSAARQVADAYVPYVESQFEYFEDLSRRLLGYEVRQILLLHANTINAERFEEMARMLERRGYGFVTLERALGDDAYAAPDDYARADGISWLQRWALDQGCSGDFLDGEPATPRFVMAQSGEGVEGRRVRWMMCLRRARQRLLGPKASAA
jgi:peptidoglycan/xylan/chitin deacetylase (PgdA/CDA1 family)